MSLIVEDGTGKTDSQTYVDAAGARTYASSRGVTLSTDDAVVESQLLQAMDYLESIYDKYQGEQVNPGVQALQWPRDDVYLFGSVAPFPDTQIPPQLIAAQVQLVMQMAAGVSLMPTRTGPFVTEDTVGPITTKYSEKIATSSIPFMPAVDAALKPLLTSPTGGLSVMRI